MTLSKEKVKKGFFIGAILLIVILFFTIIDHAIHGLQNSWGVPDYYFKDKIPAGFFWGIVGLFLARRFQNIWSKSLVVAGVIAVALQVRYFIEGYALDFVLIFLVFHFLILFFLLAGIFFLFKKYKGFADENLDMKKMIIALAILSIIGVSTFYVVFR